MTAPEARPRTLLDSIPGVNAQYPVLLAQRVDALELSIRTLVTERDDARRIAIKQTVRQLCEAIREIRDDAFGAMPERVIRAKDAALTAVNGNHTDINGPALELLRQIDSWADGHDLPSALHEPVHDLECRLANWHGLRIDRELEHYERAERYAECGGPVVQHGARS